MTDLNLVINEMKMKKTLLYLQDDWVKIITETANDICEAKGWANRASENDVIPILMALYVLKVINSKPRKYE